MFIKGYMLHITLGITFITSTPQLHAIDLTDFKNFSSSIFESSTNFIKQYSYKFASYSYETAYKYNKPVLYWTLGLTAFSIIAYKHLHTFFATQHKNSYFTLNKGITQDEPTAELEEPEITTTERIPISTTSFFIVTSVEIGNHRRYILTICDKVGIIEKIPLTSNNKTILNYYKDLHTEYLKSKS